MEEEKQLVFKHPSHRLNEENLSLNDEFTDMTIQVGDKILRSHRRILEQFGSFFRAMLSNESCKENRTRNINMSPSEVPEIEICLNYIYTGEIMITESNVFDVMLTANYVGEESLFLGCNQFLKKHLKLQDAYRAYKFSKSIDSYLIRNTAQKLLLDNFYAFSQTQEYCDLDCNSLIDILPGNMGLTVKEQQILFEGIMKWILYEFENRTSSLKMLLEAIDMSKIVADDLIKCLYKLLPEERNQQQIAFRDSVMYFYNTKKFQETSEILIVMGIIDDIIHFQTYNFEKEMWTSAVNRGDILNQLTASTVLNDNLYYVELKDSQNNLQVCNLSTYRRKVLNPSSPISLLRDSAMTAHGNFVYLCGGWNDNNQPQSNQVLRYNTLSNSFDTLAPMNCKRTGAAAIIFQNSLYVLGGEEYRSSVLLKTVEKYDLHSEKWISCPSMCEPRLGHAAVILNSKLYACGGFKRKSVEVYDSATHRWEHVASMNKVRHGFLVIAHKGKLIAIGGDEDSTVEFYEPRLNEWIMDDRMSSRLKIRFPQGGLVSVSGNNL